MQAVTKSDVSIPPEHRGREDIEPMDGVAAAAAIGFGNTVVTVKSAIAAKGVAISCSKRC